MRKAKSGSDPCFNDVYPVLSCNLTGNLALYMAGLQGQVNSLTNVANPVGLPTLDPNITPTLVPTTPIVATPTMEVSPTGKASQIIGYWSGSMQWLRDNSPPMATTMDLKSTGSDTVRVRPPLAPYTG